MKCTWNLSKVNSKPCNSSEIGLVLFLLFGMWGSAHVISSKTSVKFQLVLGHKRKYQANPHLSLCCELKQAVRLPPAGHSWSTTLRGGIPKPKLKLPRASDCLRGLQGGFFRDSCPGFPVGAKRTWTRPGPARGAARCAGC